MTWEERLSVFLRGLGIGALVGAAVAGARLRRRRSGRPADRR